MGALTYVARILWLSIPMVVAGTAHMALVKARVLGVLAIPLDGGRIWRGERIFGDNKTIRGLVAMPFFGAVAMGIQGMVAARHEWARSLGFFDYAFPESAWNAWLAGGAFGLGYALAELPNSFVKRRLRVTPGEEIEGRLRVPFIVMDQADSVLGCVAAMYVFWPPPWHVALATLGIGTALHLFINWSLYMVGLRKRPV